MSEPKLIIDQLRADDTEAWTEAVGCLRERVVWGLRARGFTRFSSEDLDEIADDAIVAGYRIIQKFNSVGQLRSYVVKAAVSDAIDRIRNLTAAKRGEGLVDTTAALHGLNQREDRRDQHTATRDEDTTNVNIDVNRCDWSVFEHLDPRDQKQSFDLKEPLAQALAKLDEESRELLIGCYYEQLTHAELAKRVGASVKSVGGRLNRAREKLACILPSWMKKERELWTQKKAH